MSELVLITGVSGYQGQWLLSTFVNRGFKVRAVLRKPATKLQNHYKSNKNVEFVFIPDLLVPEAFDNVLDGVKYIIHCASPMPQVTDDYRRDVIEPAIKATQTVLDAANKTPSVKRVVITSSIAALNSHTLDMDRPGLVVTEETKFPADRNQKDYDSPMLAYMASKALALQFTQKYMEEQKRHFDVISLCPSFISGPDFFESDRYILRTSGDNKILGTLFKERYSDLILTAPLTCVHVKDVAEAHYKALDPSIDGNQAFLLTGETVPHNTVYDLAKQLRPDIKFDKIEGLPGVFAGQYDNTKSIEVLGIEYTPFRVLLKDILDYYFCNFRRGGCTA